MNFDLTPRKWSYLIPLLDRELGKQVFDFYAVKGYERHFLEEEIANIQEDDIVYLDDELFFHNNYENVDLLETFADRKPRAVICKVNVADEIFKRVGIKSVYSPFFHSVDDTISMKKLGEACFPQNRNAGNFYCLNRNYAEHKAIVVGRLLEHGLTDQGIITANASGFPIQMISTIENDLLHYSNTLAGLERHNHCVNDVWLSSNVANVMFICKNIPGVIGISAETRYRHDFFPTEKSILPFHTKRIPLVLGRKGLNAELRQEGFDMFDDMIDYSFDTVEDFRDRMKKAIDDNLDILKSPPKWDDISERVDRNFGYVTGEWLDAKIQHLIRECR